MHFHVGSDVTVRGCEGVHTVIEIRTKRSQDGTVTKCMLRFLIALTFCFVLVDECVAVVCREGVRVPAKIDDVLACVSVVSAVAIETIGTWQSLLDAEEAKNKAAHNTVKPKTPKRKNPDDSGPRTAAVDRERARLREELAASHVALKAEKAKIAELKRANKASAKQKDAQLAQLQAQLENRGKENENEEKTETQTDRSRK